MEALGLGFGVSYVVVAVLLLVLVICWILLPFAMFGTKPLLRQLLAEAKRTNAILERRLPGT